jgi:UrcA family protein
METEPAQKHSRNSQAPEHGLERVTRSPFATPAGCGRDAQEPIAQEIAMKNFFSIATIIVLGFAATSVANADPQAPQSLTVQFGDHNLNNAQGVDALFKRIKNAAESVCNEFEGRSLKEKQLYSDCVDTALSTAITRVDRPMLSRYLAGHSTTPRNVSVPVASTR